MPRKRYAWGRTGQALVEYVLMVALVSTLTLAFVRFFSRDVFKTGLEALPTKVAPCVSNLRPGANPNACR